MDSQKNEVQEVSPIRRLYWEMKLRKATSGLVKLNGRMVNKPECSATRRAKSARDESRKICPTPVDMPEDAVGLNGVWLGGTAILINTDTIPAG